MFFADILVKNKVLEKAWRAGFNQTGELNNTSLPQICQKLDRWVGSEDMDARRRMSLRTSAVLVEGAARLYRKEMQQLIEDAAKLDENMAFRNKRYSDREEDSTKSSLESFDTPEQMMRRAEIHPDVSFEAHTRDNSISPPDLRKSHKFSYSNSPERPINIRNNSYISSYDSSIKNGTDDGKTTSRTSAENSDRSIVTGFSDKSQTPRRSTILNSIKNAGISKKRRNKKELKKLKDQATQTVSFDPQSNERDNLHFQNSLPYGYLLIHDSYQSKIPTKIVFSSLNKDVNNLVCL